MRFIAARSTIIKHPLMSSLPAQEIPIAAAPWSAPRRASCQPPRGLPLFVAAAGAATVLLCFVALGFGILGASSLTPEKVEASVTRAAVTAPPAMLPAGNALAVTSQRLHDEIKRQRRAEAKLGLVETKLQARMAVLQDDERNLNRKLQQERASLREAEEASRRALADRAAAETHRAELENEAATLETRIAELRASIAEIEESLQQNADQKGTAPVIVECVRGSVILQPRQLRIPVDRLRDGPFAPAVRLKSVHFLVRPDGFESFLLARSVARGVGARIIAEPRARGKE